MLVHMATAKKAPAVKTARADGRVKSALTIAGETAKLEAERALLRETLVANDWNLTRCAALLRVGQCVGGAARHRPLRPARRVRKAPNRCAQSVAKVDKVGHARLISLSPQGSGAQCVGPGGSGR